MTLNANKFALAAAISFALLWVLCSLIVALIPNQTMYVSGTMLHSNVAWQWDMHWLGLLIGLVAWSLTAGISAWLIATIYNHLVAGGREGESHV
ncbi:MAG: DUF5676 family membrane protein [Motiliproteus sp.]|nr:DUF5676 family membrane protein [Motiliproteus sp.]MCW9053396.1 DUF5676 family membrane protein [Motiliproteus sp.]